MKIDERIIVAERLARLIQEENMSEEVRACLISQIDGLNEAINIKIVSIPELKETAKNLCFEANTQESEYVRGIAELIADFDGIEDMPHAERACEIATQLGYSKQLYNSVTVKSLLIILQKIDAAGQLALHCGANDWHQFISLVLVNTSKFRELWKQ